MELGLAIGGAFLSSVLQVLFDRLAPQGQLLKMFQRSKHDPRLLNKLRMTLLGLQAVLTDAEDKQPSNRHVSQWLNELQDAVDTADNLLEELNYEALRLKVEGQHQHQHQCCPSPIALISKIFPRKECPPPSEGTSRQQVHDLNLCFSDGFLDSVMPKLEVTFDTLKGLEEQIDRLGLIKCIGSGKQDTPKRLPSTSLVDESGIFGRKDETEQLVNRLLSVDANGENLDVIPIVGMGGLGKTTLAKAIYNDKRVNGHFDTKAWICVSEEYDALRITKGLLEEIDSLDKNVENNLNQLQIKLKDNLKEKKFLLILDDVWNDNYNVWDDLRSPFAQGKLGSKIIVTTRKESVASMMCSSKPINLTLLSTEDSWSLFERHAYVNKDFKEHADFEEVGRKIVDKCKGLPLALKTLAGVLRSKYEVEEWRCVLRSEVWELPSSDIIPALKLSYNDLPAHLKPCFAYCAIFPKDYPFNKEQVMHLWIANGLVQQIQNDEIIEDSANQYFLELRSRSMFEKVPESSQKNTEEFLMHDLVNDLARFVSSKLCISLEDHQGSQMSERTRHLSYSIGYQREFEKLKPIYELKQLRTLLAISSHSYVYGLSKRVLHNILPKVIYLRALSLSQYSMEELPDVLFIKLKHLRFLDLSRTMIKKLPDSVCVLYNLEKLLLSYCDHLEELPLEMDKMINLRYLDISGTSLSKMPLQPSKLKKLHVLLGATFIVGGYSGSRIRELGELHNIHGKLSVSKLQNVIDGRDAIKAKMRGKEHVEELSLEWSDAVANDSQNELDILDKLQPNTNIKGLRITGYRGTKFSNWIADHSYLKQLVELSLINCKNCYSLPALGQLPSLKFLSIKGIHRISEVAEEFYGNSSSIESFKSLEKLEFVDMPEWKEWHVSSSNGVFPKLEDLTIRGCPKLNWKLHKNLRSLNRLEISTCPGLILETDTQFQAMKQLSELSIAHCSSLTSLLVRSLPSTLKKIRIWNCGELKLELELELPVNEAISCGCNLFLEELEMRNCDSIVDISPGMIPRTRNLTVKGCSNLRRLLIPTEIIETLRVEKCENLELVSAPCGTHQPSLRALTIENCDSLMSFPEGGLAAPTLKRMNIQNCRKLKSLPGNMQQLLPSLETLRVLYCPEIESFGEGGLPLNLESLWIYNCLKLVDGRKEWQLQRLTCLKELRIKHHDGSDNEDEDEDEEWELPCSIRRLIIHDMKTLFKSSPEVLKSLISLEYLRLHSIPGVQSVLEEGLLPSSLSELRIEDCNELESLPTQSLQSLTSLHTLRINNCHQLRSLLESWLLPSSLSKLSISNCHNLQSLPESGLPSSLSSLQIDGCPKLKARLEFEKGDYWPYISHIPHLQIDEVEM